MIKLLSLVCSLLLLHYIARAQIPYHILPSGIIGIQLADTMLNTKEVLLKAGIKSYRYQITPASDKRFDSQSVCLNKQGNVIAYKMCMTRSSERPGFCVKDSFFYDEKDRLSEYISFDGNGKVSDKRVADYSNEHEIKYMHVFALPNPDTSFEFRDYSEQGRLTGIMHALNINNRKDIAYTKLYYNKDGVLDSAHDGFSAYGTMFFKKKVIKDRTILEAENKAFSFKWTYDASGKCIEMEWNGIKAKASSKFVSKYYYNIDGTLAKVTEKSGKMPEYVINYSYEKW